MGSWSEYAKLFWTNDISGGVSRINYLMISDSSSFGAPMIPDKYIFPACGAADSSNLILGMISALSSSYAAAFENSLFIS